MAIVDITSTANKVFDKIAYLLCEGIYFSSIPILQMASKKFHFSILVLQIDFSGSLMVTYDR